MTNDIYFCYFNLRSQDFAMSYWCEYIILLSRSLEDSLLPYLKNGNIIDCLKQREESLRVPA